MVANGAIVLHRSVVGSGAIVAANAVVLYDDVNWGSIGKATELKKRMPHMDFSELEKDPDINKMQFTVNTIVNYLDTKLNGQTA